MESSAQESHGFPVVFIVFFAALAVFWLCFTPAFVSDDSYFYLVIARNLALHRGLTFSQLYPTNGVHPAWQAVVGCYAWVISIFDVQLLNSPRTYVPLPLVFLVWASANFIRVFKRLNLESSVPVLLMAGCLSVLGVLFSEAHLSYFALSCLARVSNDGDEESWRHAAKLGLAAAFVFLARLDSVFLLPPLYVWYLKRTGSWRKVSLASLAFAILALPYLGYNYFVFGSIIPISGWLKSTFPVVHVAGVEMARFQTTLSGYNILFGVAPLSAAVLIVLCYRREIRAERHLAVLVVFLTGAVLHAVYNILYTSAHGGWYWYYVLPLTASSLGLGLLLKHWMRERDVRRLASLLCVFLVLLLVVRVRREHAGGDKYLTPEQEAIIDLVNHVGITRSVILVHDWPGALAFYSPGNKVVPADMIMANRRLYGRIKASADGLRFLLSFIREKGEDHVFIIAAPDRGLLKPTVSLDRLILSSVKPLENQDVLGQLDVGQPVCSFSYEAGNRLYAWKVDL